MNKKFSIAKITGYLYCLYGFFTLFLFLFQMDLSYADAFVTVLTLSLAMVPFLLGIGFLKSDWIFAIFVLVIMPIWAFFTLVPIGLVAGSSGRSLLFFKIAFVFFLVLLVLTILTILVGIRKRIITKK